jgi:hypothetical protein
MITVDKIGIGVVTSSNLKKRYNACKNTWLKDFDNTYLFGGNGNDPSLINITESGEDYRSHFLKQQLGLKNKHKPDYILILAHNFADYIVESLKNQYDGKFILLIPEPIIK